MITLTAQDLQWVRGDLDDPDDQCAHGRVELTVDGTTFVRSEDGRWTVSAAALYLLRTLSDDHTEAARVAEGNLLFPCCGFIALPEKGKYGVVLIGCPNGVDVRVTHGPRGVTLSSQEGEQTVTEKDWRQAVIGFVRQVEDFYRASSPKLPPSDDEDRRGWSAFWREWNERVAAATTYDRQPFNPISDDQAD